MHSSNMIWQSNSIRNSRQLILNRWADHPLETHICVSSAIFIDAVQRNENNSNYLQQFKLYKKERLENWMKKHAFEFSESLNRFPVAFPFTDSHVVLLCFTFLFKTFDDVWADIFSCGFNNNYLKLMRCFNSFVMSERFKTSERKEEKKWRRGEHDFSIIIFPFCCGFHSRSVQMREVYVTSKIWCVVRNFANDSRWTVWLYLQSILFKFFSSINQENFWLKINNKKSCLDLLRASLFSIFIINIESFMSCVHFVRKIF